MKNWKKLKTAIAICQQFNASTESSQKETWRDFYLHPSINACKKFLKAYKSKHELVSISEISNAQEIEMQLTERTETKLTRINTLQYSNLWKVRNHQETNHEKIKLWNVQNGLYYADACSHGLSIIEKSGNHAWIEESRINFPFTADINNLDKNFSVIEEQSIFIASIQYGNNYFHWLIELTPKLLIASKLLKAGFINKIIVDDIRHQWQWEIIDIVNIPRESIEIGYHNYLARARSIYFCQARLPIRSSTHYAKQIIQLIEQSGPIESPNKLDLGDYLFISRRDAQQRKLVNAIDFAQVLKHKGFAEISLSGLTLYEQMLIFSNVKIAIFEHGAAMANMIFMKPCTTVIEICSPWFMADLFATVSEEMNLRYFPFFVNQSAQPESLSSKDSDYKIEINYFCRFLDKILRKSSQ